jgi:hypothetical protein
MRQDGYSMLETVVAMALLLTVAAVTVSLRDASQASFAVEAEAADMHQRLRVAAGTLSKDLLMAGAGVYQGVNKGPLAYYFAPVLPYRRGTKRDDPSGIFRADAITLMYIPSTVAQTTLATNGPSGVSADIGVNGDAGCPVGDAVCGFNNGMTVLLFDSSGDYDPFTITNIQSNLLHVDSASGNLTRTNYQSGTTRIVQLTTIVYYLKSNPATETYQLMSVEGGTGSDVPVADHIVALTFDYYGDPQPPMLTSKPLTDPVGPWTTYGPPPPALGQQIPTNGYPPGENCVFMVDPITGLQLPRLNVLGTNPATNPLVQLTSAQLTDGPWCPDALSANRWDADLLRIRRIGVTLRVESAVAAMRGPASALFAHGGTSTSARKWLPDQQVTFQVSPRNLGR